MNDKLVEKIAKLLEKWEDTAFFIEKNLAVSRNIAAEEILQAILSDPNIVEIDPEICPYCKKKANAAMLTMNKSMAHSDCVIRKLNELLDPDWEIGRQPDKIIVVKGKNWVEIDPDAELPEFPIPYMTENSRYDSEASNEKTKLIHQGYDQALEDMTDWVKKKC